MNEIEILGRVSLFSHLKPRDLKRIAKLSRHCAFASEFSHEVCPDCTGKVCSTP